MKDLAKNFDQVRRITVGLEHLPYCLGAASLAMFDLVRNQKAIASVKAATIKPGTTQELSEAERNALGYRLDSFLDAARRAQNALIPYLRTKCPPGTHLAKSLAAVVGQLAKGVVVLPEPFKSDLQDYWHAYGAKVKDYRDLSQHYMIVGTAAKVYLPQDAEPMLMFCMPSNPEVRQITELRYDNPTVHVQKFVIDNFFSLLAFCYGVLEKLLDPEIDAALVPGFEGQAPLTRIGSSSATEAYVPLNVGDLEEFVQEALKHLRDHFDKKQADVPDTRVNDKRHA